MSKQKDELITASELARRLDVDPSHINRQRTKFKDAKCMFGKKFYYIKSCDFLGKDPNDPHKSRQSNLQTDIKSDKKKSTKKNIPKSNENWTVRPPKEGIEEVRKSLGISKEEEQKIISKINEGLDGIDDTQKRMAQCGTGEDENQDSDSEAKDLLDQILASVKGGNNRHNRATLDILRQKAGVLREYFTAKNEEIKNRKLEDNLFEKDEVIQILSFAMNMIRNSLINLPNNYAVNLESMEQKEIKEYVTDDVNKILEDLQNIGNQFE